MPLYDLKCANCTHIFETLCASNDWEQGRVPCPSCAHTVLERAYTRPAGVSVKPSKSAMPACPSSGAACPHAGRCGIPS